MQESKEIIQLTVSKPERYLHKDMKVLITSVRTGLDIDAKQSTQT